MKISRWIIFPLFYTFVYSVAQILVRLILGDKISISWILTYFVLGVFVAFTVQYISYTKAREISKDRDERVFDVYQNRVFTVLLNQEKSFEICREAVMQYKRHAIKNEDPKNGVILAGICQTPKWYEIFKTIVRIELRKINDDLTEIELTIDRKWRKNLSIAAGNNWKLAEDILNYIKTKDAEINRKVLTDSAVILDDVYVKPFQKQTQN